MYISSLYSIEKSLCLFVCQSVPPVDSSACLSPPVSIFLYVFIVYVCMCCCGSSDVLSNFTVFLKSDEPGKAFIFSVFIGILVATSYLQSRLIGSPILLW